MAQAFAGFRLIASGAMRTLLVAVAIVTLGCLSLPVPGTDAGGATVDANDAAMISAHVAIWHLPRVPSADFSLPWPNDLARGPSGNIDLSYIPNGNNNSLVSQYVQQFTNTLDGFSPIGAVYFRFSTDLDPSSLPPDASSSRSATASVQIIDIDPASPDHMLRTPAQWIFRAASTAYWPAETLAVAPVAGFPLRPHTRYAVVLTSALRATDGSPYARDHDLDDVVSPTPPASTDATLLHARTVYATALSEIIAAGVDRTQVLSIAVFTTQDPTGEYFRGADWLLAQGPMPTLVDLSAPTVSAQYTVLRGHYGPNPVFQQGTSPYTTPGSGDFVLDASGTPTVQGSINVHFSLSLPPGPMPLSGWPVAIYAHGTGGNADSFLDDGTGAAAAAQNVAMLGFDQIFNGERSDPVVNADAAFFNFANAHAGRTNNRQAALDLVQCGRFVRTFTFPLVNADGTTTMVHFDPSRVMFFGHSQGGLNGPLWLAAEDGARTAVLSGAAGELVLSLMLKTQPVNVPQLLGVVLGAQPGELGPLHPVLTLAQTLADPADPVNYGRFIVHEPRPGMHPKNIFQTQGFIDHYAPPPAIAALALSIGLPLTGTIVRPEPAYPLTGLTVQPLPLHNNLAGTTGAWMQFVSAPGSDGHFVVFDIPGARLRAAAFLGTAAQDPQGLPTVLATVP